MRFFLFITLFFIVILCSNAKNVGSKLTIFVGEIIGVKDGGLPEGFSLDARKIIIKYKVIKKVYGKINFDQQSLLTVASTLSPLLIKKHTHVLVYRVEEKGKYYHLQHWFLKYTILHKTKEGRWAGVFKNKYITQIQKNQLKIVPKKVKFNRPVIFNFSKRSPFSIKELKQEYPNPYYRWSGKKAIAEYGFYIKDLIWIKNAGVLKSEGLKVDLNRIRH